IVRGKDKILPGGNNGEEADGYKQRREPDHVASSSGSGVLRPWGAEDAGLVWRRWFSWNYESPYADGNVLSGCIADHLRSILWGTGTDCGTLHPHRFSGRRRPDDRGDLHGSPAERLLHELDGNAEGRGNRISSAGARYGRGAAAARGGRVFAGSGAFEVGDVAVQCSLARLQTAQRRMPN